MGLKADKVLIELLLKVQHWLCCALMLRFWEESFFSRIQCSGHWRTGGMKDYISLLGLSQQNTTKWVASNSRNLFSHSFGGQKSEIKTLTGPCSDGSRRESVPCLSLAFGGCWQSLAFLGLKMHHSNLCLHFYMVFILCVMSVSLFSLLIRTSVILD